MLVLRQFVIVTSGCVLGAVVAGMYLAASAPAATRSLDYLVTAIVFLIGFAAGSALAGRFTAKAAALQPATPAPIAAQKVASLGELVPAKATTFSRNPTRAG